MSEMKNRLERTAKPLVSLDDFQIHSESVGYLLTLSKPIEPGIRKEFRAPAKTAFQFCNDVDESTKQLLSELLGISGAIRIQVWNQYSFTFFTTHIVEPTIVFSAIVSAILNFYGGQVEFILKPGVANPMSVNLTDIAQTADPLLLNFLRALGNIGIVGEGAEELAAHLVAIARINKNVK